MRQQNRKGNFSKHTNNAYGYGNPNEYDHYKVEKPAQLLEWLMENVKGPSKTKVKQTLQGRGNQGGWQKPSPSLTMPETWYEGKREQDQEEPGCLQEPLS